MRRAKFTGLETDQRPAAILQEITASSDQAGSIKTAVNLRPVHSTLRRCLPFLQPIFLKMLPITFPGR
jgi:hypothetical protein